jgi:hypothetical protein
MRVEDREWIGKPRLRGRGDICHRRVQNRKQRIRKTEGSDKAVPRTRDDDLRFWCGVTETLQSVGEIIGDIPDGHWRLVPDADDVPVGTGRHKVPSSMLDA